MSPFQRLAIFIVVRDTGYIALAGATLMIAFSFYMPLALAIGASAALLVSIALLTRAGRLADNGLVRSEPWRTLPPEQRPQGERALRQAREGYEDLLFRSAKAAAAHAVALFAAALVASFSHRIAPAHGILTASLD